MDRDRWNDRGLIPSAIPIIRNLVTSKTRTQAETARIFGVSRQCINNVVKERTHKRSALDTSSTIE